MLELSVIVNVDTRAENDNNQEMFRGVVSRDFLIDGLLNKRKLLEGFEYELICYVDEHEPIDEKTLSYMREICDVLVIRKHNKFFEEQENYPAFNDMNYIQALSQARGKYIFHFDGDVAAFAESKEPIEYLIRGLEQYDYISYPSLWSPYPTHDDSWQNKFWASTRFFCCKRSTIDISELIKCQLDYDYWKNTYPMPKLCHWLEHILASIAHNKGKGVLYPPVNFEKFILFTWENYHQYTLQRLNNQSFQEVKDWFKTKDFHYPNNLSI